MRIISLVTDTASMSRILAHIGEPTRPPVLSPARAAPAEEESFDQTRLFDPLAAAPEPAFEFEGHTAPLGMRFYTGDMFPSEYRGAVFVAEHGTEPTTPTSSRSQVSGDRISVLRLGPDGAVLDYENFGQFAFTSNATYTRRPVDLLVLPDGSLLVSDDQRWRVYRITYEP